MERANASVARMAAESDLNDKVGSLSEDRNALESGLVVLGQHMGGRINALEWENAELNSRLGEADKVIIIRGIRTALKSLARAIPHML